MKKDLNVFCFLLTQLIMSCGGGTSSSSTTLEPESSLQQNQDRKDKKVRSIDPSQALQGFWEFQGYVKKDDLQSIEISKNEVLAENTDHGIFYFLEDQVTFFYLHPDLQGFDYGFMPFAVYDNKLRTSSTLEGTTQISTTSDHIYHLDEEKLIIEGADSQVDLEDLAALYLKIPTDATRRKLLHSPDFHRYYDKPLKVIPSDLKLRGTWIYRPSPQHEFLTSALEKAIEKGQNLIASFFSNKSSERRKDKGEQGKFSRRFQMGSHQWNSHLKDFSGSSLRKLRGGKFKIKKSKEKVKSIILNISRDRLKLILVTTSGEIRELISGPYSFHYNRLFLGALDDYSNSLLVHQLGGIGSARLLLLSSLKYLSNEERPSGKYTLIKSSRKDVYETYGISL